MLKGKVAIVTGSTSGIGLGIARALASEGAHVVINGIADQATINAAKKQVRGGKRVRVIYHGADMTKPEQIEDMIKSTIKQFGRLDIVVNNAGIQHTARVEDFPPEKWDAILSINLTSAFHTSRHALPAMQKQGWGRIINIASVHGLVASENKAAYVAAKHGIVGLTKVVALENAQSGVTCNAICPGWVRTPLVEKQIADQAAKKGISIEEAARQLLEEKQPSGRFVEVEQLGKLVLLLCSSAADQITGTEMVADGGWTAR